MMTIEKIAKIVHSVNREIQRVNGENPDPLWAEMVDGDWWRVSSIEAVQQLLDDPNTDFREQHQQWYDERIRQGWTWGPVKDATKKTNPALIPYNELPGIQRLKDYTRKVIVEALRAELPVKAIRAGMQVCAYEGCMREFPDHHVSRFCIAHDPKEVY